MIAARIGDTVHGCFGKADGDRPRGAATGIELPIYRRFARPRADDPGQTVETGIEYVEVAVELVAPQILARLVTTPATRLGEVFPYGPARWLRLANAISPTLMDRFMRRFSRRRPYEAGNDGTDRNDGR